MLLEKYRAYNSFLQNMEQELTLVKNTEFPLYLLEMLRLELQNHVGQDYLLMLEYMNEEDVKEQKTHQYMRIQQIGM